MRNILYELRHQCKKEIEKSLEHLPNDDMFGYYYYSSYPDPFVLSIFPGLEGAGLLGALGRIIKKRNKNVNKWVNKKSVLDSLQK